MAQLIEHCGIINELDAERIYVLISGQSACSACHAKDVCFTAHHVEKIIEVENTHPLFKKGDRVIVTGKNSMGLQAVLFGFVLPLFLIVITLIILSLITREVISGSLAILVLLPYYGILSFFNLKLKTNFRFDIRKEAEELV